MYLTKKCITNEYRTTFNIERVADDLLMVNIEVVDYSPNELCYWRLTDVCEAPPLEIGVDLQTGIVNSITLFVDEIYRADNFEIEGITQNGLITVDTGVFLKSNKIYDVNQKYKVFIIRNRLLCCFDNGGNFVHRYQNDRLEMYSNAQREIIGFSVCNISEKEKEVLEPLISEMGEAH